MILDEAYFDVPQATRIIGLSDGQIANWVARYEGFSSLRPGRGRNIRFQFRDLLTLAAIKSLIDSNLCEPKNAIPLLDNSSLYGLMLDHRNPRPGYLVLTKTQEGLKTYFDPSARPELQVHIDLWFLCDDILPRAFDVIREQGAEKVEDEIQKARDFLDKFRPAR